MNEAAALLLTRARRLSYAASALALCLCAHAAQSKPHPRPHAMSVADQVIAAQIAFNKNEAAANLVALKNMLMPDFVQADKAILNREQLIDLLQRGHSLPCHFGTETIEHPVVTFLDPDIATIAYHSAENDSCGGLTLHEEANISAVWINAGGVWKARVRSEIITSENAK